MVGTQEARVSINKRSTGDEATRVGSEKTIAAHGECGPQMCPFAARI
jgi:hypothetical protein